MYQQIIIKALLFTTVGLMGIMEIYVSDSPEASEIPEVSYETEAEQNGYATDYLYGSRSCPQADDPTELVLSVTKEALEESGCTDIFEL